MLLSIAFGGLDQIFLTLDPAVQPAAVGLGRSVGLVGQIFARGSIYQRRLRPHPGVRGGRDRPLLLIGYPFAYFLARHAGRCKGLFLVAFIAPFWISYMMRMLAWINLLQPTAT